MNGRQRGNNQVVADIAQGRQRALTREPNKRPKHHRIKLAAAGGLERCLELGTLPPIAGGIVRKFLHDLPTSLEVPESYCVSVVAVPPLISH